MGHWFKSGEPHPVMAYVNELEGKVRELKEEKKQLMMTCVYVSTFRTPIAFCVGLLLGAGSMVAGYVLGRWL